jgi:glycosyltransferase involved in cell wall biosynthesis
MALEDGLGTIVLVVPCYNEARRLSPSGFASFLDFPDLKLLFVDDGSTDATPTVLAEICGTLHGRARVISLEANGGKAEAVRRGLLDAMASGARVVGYYDADLATPPSEMWRVISALGASEVQVAMGARVSLLGSDIRRLPIRHYLGRVFATFASIVLDLSVYDTQCGAKAFRTTPLLQAVLSTPFISRWAFDVELIGRLLRGTLEHNGLRKDGFLEVPLRAWHDMAGSKVRLADGPRMALELIKIRRGLGEMERRTSREAT